MPIEKNTRTVQDVINRVFRTYGDESGVQLTENDVIMAIEQAQQDIVMHNREVNAVYAEVSVAGGTSSYDLATLPNILRIHSIHYNNRYLPNVSFQQAQESIAGAEEVGTPTLWYEYGGVIHLFPAPEESLENGLKIFYNKSPDRITSTGDFLSVPDNYFTAVVDYCLAKANEMDENAQMAKLKMEDFGRSITANSQDTIAESRTNPTVRDVYGDY